jgi:ATP-dependent DNA helicase RecG
MPAGDCRELPWQDLPAAIRFLHRPPRDADVHSLLENRHPAQRRLAVEELTAHQLSMIRLRTRFRKQSAPAIHSANDLQRRFIGAMTFALTNAQQRVIDEIHADMSRSSPMLRLVQGDVGSGKTVVALAACLNAVEAGYQAAMMAPTELLAEQHYQNFTAWLAPLGITVAWLSGKLKAVQRREILNSISQNQAAIIVGTHALFQEEVEFHRLALVVIDEQHRFGVHQRLALRNKGATDAQNPHQLIMTATPIPRSLSLAQYGDMDISVLDEKPPGRKPIATAMVNMARMDEVVEKLRHAIAEGRQAYWVCPLVTKAS